MNYNRFLFIITLIFPLFNQLHAELPFIYLKDLYNKVSKDYKYLSPVNGFHWWKLGIIENLYRFGDQNDETVKLIRELFYLQPWDNVTFDITTLDNKPAKYLTSRTIGKILALFESNVPVWFTEKNEAEFKESLKQVIKDDLQFSTLMAQAQKKKEQHELQLVQLPQRMSEIDAELKRLAKSKQQTEKFLRYKQKNLEEMAGSGASKEKIAQLTESIKSDQNILDSINQKINQFTGYKIKFSELGQLRKQITQDIAKEGLAEKSLDRFIDHLVGCYKESIDSPNQLYPKFTFHQIMLGFLWKKVQQKPELVDYFAAFFNYNIPIIASSELVSGKIPEWLSEASKYTAEDFNSYKDMLPEDDFNFILENYEFVSFMMYGYIALGDFILPPIISSIANTKYKNYTFPDCVETSLRNLINIKIFDAHKDLLDINSLLKTSTMDQFPLQLAQAMIEFYEKNNHIESIDSDILHNEWANVVSELPGIHYRIENICNIASGSQNIFKVINHILFGNNPAFDALSNSEKLNILCDRLSKNNTILNWESIEDIDGLEEFIVKFTINKEDNTEDFEWNIKSNHSVISTAKFSVSQLNDLSFQLIQTIKEDPQSFQINNLASWLLDPEKISRQILYEPITVQTGEGKYLITSRISINREKLLAVKILCYAQKLNNNETKNELLSVLLPLTKETNELDGLTTRLISALPQDFHFQQSLLRSLLDASERYYHFIPKIIENEPEEYNKIYLINDIIDRHGSGNQSLIGLLKKAIKSLRNDQDIYNVLSQMISKKDRIFDTILIEYFDKIFEKKDPTAFFYVASIILDQKTINETLEKTIRSGLQYLARQMDIISLIRYIPPNANAYVINLVNDAIMRTQQQLKKPEELISFNNQLASKIFFESAAPLYPLAIDIMERQLQQQPTPELERRYKKLLKRQKKLTE